MKNKKEKKVVIDFDKIDVTTATNEEIIESGIKKNTKADKRNYLFMVLIFLFILIPPFLRLFFPKPILFVDKEIVYLKQNCFLSVNRHDNTWRFDSSYDGYYRDGKLEKVVLEYTYQKNIETAKEGLTFAEINELSEKKVEGFEGTKFQKDVEGEKIDGYRFTMDFKGHRDSLVKDDLFLKYSYGNSTVLEYLKSTGFMCPSADVETKMETVSVNE